MVDIHSHILPGLDDGARTMAETLELIEFARAHGTTTLVASPHADPEYSYDPQRVDDLLLEAQQKVGNGIRLVRGCDFHLMFANIKDALKHPGRYTINGKCYLLVELSDLIVFPNTSQIWSQLENVGMKIILTHPERNPLIQQRIQLVEEWVQQGRYMQVTAHSLLGLFGETALHFARTMLDRGLVHFIASDAHDIKVRSPRLDQAFEWLTKHYSPRLAELLCIEHPMAAVEGRAIDLLEFPPELRRRSLPNIFYRLFGR